MRSSAITLLVALLVTFAPVIAGAADKPNFIVILADDLGYGDLSCYGGQIETPAIDRIAARGLRFTNAYAPAATCSPTRYALLTGEYAWRQPPKKTSILDGDAPLAIDLGRTTIASLLKNAGYATGIVGKWHLGLGDGKRRLDFNGSIEPGPIEVGFDESFIIPATVDRVPSVWVENHHVHNLDPNDPIFVSYTSDLDGDGPSPDYNEPLKVSADKQHSGSNHNGISRIGYQKGGKSARFIDEELPKTVVERSTTFIKKHKDNPFFLLVGLFEPHVPRAPHKMFAGRSNCGVRGDTILQIDWEVRQIIECLRSNNIEDNTVVIVTSDNGPVLFDGYFDHSNEDLHGHEPTAKLRGWKYLVYEGGVRVPFVVQWPKQISTPGISQQILSLTDIIATFADITGQKIPASQARDSLSMSQIIAGKSKTGPRHSVALQGVFNAFALRDEQWKFIKANAGAGAAGIGRGADPNDERFKEAVIRKDELYDLQNDPHEIMNLAAKMPNKAAEMREELDHVMK